MHDPAPHFRRPNHNRQSRNSRSRKIVAPVEQRCPEKDDEKEDRRSRPTLPVAAAQRIIGGAVPAALPMTIFCGVHRLSHIV